MKRYINIRFIIQMVILFSVIIAASNRHLASMGIDIPWISESIFHYICPICGVSSMYQFFASSTIWVVKVKSILGIVVGIVIVATILFGPIICGYICPFGAIQDITARVGKKMFGVKYNNFVKEDIENKLRFTRYIALVLTISITALSGIAILESINPYHALLGIFNTRISLLGLVILCLVIVASLFIHRPWCKYLCPYGALLGLSNKIKVFRVIRKESSCIGCKKCNKKCPMNIVITENEAVRDIRCISCLECCSKNVCMKENTISYTSKDLEFEEHQELLKVNGIEDYINEERNVN